MERLDFITKMHEELKKINKRDYPMEDSLCKFDLYIDEVEHEKDYLNQLDLFINGFLKENSLYKKNILDEITIKKELDHYYLEDLENDQDYYRYNITFDSNDLYDAIARTKAIKKDMSTIYRIEKENGEGLYSSIGLALLKDYDNQPSPSEDDKLNFVFHKNIYSSFPSSKNYKKWQFGFESIEKATLWIGDQNVIDKLSQNSLKLVKYSIPKAFVVHGNKQSIFQKKYVEKIELLDLNLLKTGIEKEKTSENVLKNSV